MKIKELSKFSNGMYEIVGKVAKKTLKTKENDVLHAVVTLTDETGSIHLDLKSWQANQVEMGDIIHLKEASIKQTKEKPRLTTWEKKIEIIEYADPKRKIAAIQAEKERTSFVGKGVKVYDEESFLQRSSGATVTLYNKIKKMVLALADDIVVKPTKTYIGFKHETNFVDVITYRSFLKIYINMKHGQLEDTKELARDVSDIGHFGNGEYEIKISDDTELDYIMTLVKQSFEMH